MADAVHLLGEPIEVGPTRAAARLTDLGVDLNRLAVGLDDGDVAARQLDEFAPRTGPGLSRWITTVGGLRRGLAADGWTVDDKNNVPLAVSPNGRVAIRVASGTRATGVAGGDGPQRKHPKPKGRKHRKIPGQLALDLLGAWSPVDEVPGRQIWWLLYYRSRSDELRAELSMAYGEESGGELRWRERILLPPRTFGPDVAPPADAGLNDDVYFAVTAR